jgi:hypothetical protein
MPTRWVVDYEAVASAAKYLGLGFTTLLGVAGTVAETNEKTASGVKVTPTGWRVVVAIVLSACIGAVGQHYESKAKERADLEAKKAQNEQISRLVRVADISERSLMRFSGHVSASIWALVRMDQPALREATARIDARMKANPRAYIQTVAEEEYGQAFPNTEFSVKFEERTKTRAGTYLAFSVSPPQMRVRIANFHPDTRTMYIEFTEDPSIGSSGFFSLKDFANRRVYVEASSADNAGNGVAMDIVVDSISITDSDLNTTLHVNWFKPISKQEYQGDRTLRYEAFTGADVGPTSASGWG